MLRNPVFAGQMQSKKWGTRKGLHEPLINEQLYRDVQLVLRGKKRVMAPYQLNRSDFSLRKFVRCSECSTPLARGPSRSKTGRRYDYYRCYKCRAISSLPTEKASGEMNMVRPERFELPTLWFEAKCSIQLSYGRVKQESAITRAS
jgi:hypothetical protein